MQCFTQRSLCLLSRERPCLPNVALYAYSPCLTKSAVNPSIQSTNNTSYHFIQTKCCRLISLIRASVEGSLHFNLIYQSFSHLFDRGLEICTILKEEIILNNHFHSIFFFGSQWRAWRHPNVEDSIRWLVSERNSYESKTWREYKLSTLTSTFKKVSTFKYIVEMSHRGLSN